MTILDIVVDDLNARPRSFVPLEPTRHGNEGSADFLHHVSSGIDVVVKTFHDPFFPDAVDRHCRASDVFRSVLPGTPHSLAMSDHVVVSIFAGSSQVPPSCVLPIDVMVDSLPFHTFSRPLLTHSLAALVLGKGDAVENALGYVCDDQLHIAPIDNSYTFFEIPSSTSDLVIDTFDFDDDLRHHLSLASPTPVTAVLDLLTTLENANDRVNVDNSLFHTIVSNNINTLRQPVNLDRIVKGTLS